MRGLRITETRRARGLRQSQTPAEARLWSKLRSRGLAGHKLDGVLETILLALEQRPALGVGNPS